MDVWIIVGGTIVAAAAAAMLGRFLLRKFRAFLVTPSDTLNWQNVVAADTAKLMTTDPQLLELAARFPGSPTPLATWTSSAITAGDWPEALRRSEVFISRFKFDIFGYLAGARACLQTGQFEKAEGFLAAAVDMFPDSSRPLFDYALVSHYKGDFGEAANRWAYAKQQFPSEPRGYVWEAIALLALGDPDAAQQRIADAVAMFPDDPEAVFWYAEMPHRRGDWATAVTRWAQVRRQLDSKVEGYERGCQALRHLGRISEAADVLDEGLMLFPKSEALLREKLLLVNVTRA